MERPVMFVQSLLVLLVAIHATSACTCSMLTWEKSMCPARGKTVVRTSVDSSVSNGMYQMRLKETFKDGPNKLSVNNDIFSMRFPLESSLCGRRLDENEDYVIVGDVKEDGILYSNMCQLVLIYAHIADNRNVMEILQGVREPYCEDLYAPLSRWLFD